MSAKVRIFLSSRVPGSSAVVCELFILLLGSRNLRGWAPKSIAVLNVERLPMWVLGCFMILWETNRIPRKPASGSASTSFPRS